MKKEISLLVSSILFVVLKSPLFFLLFIYEIIINQCVSTRTLKTRECIRPADLEFKYPKPKRKSRFFIISMVLAVTCFIGYNMYLLYDNTINTNISIIGHRGFEDKALKILFRH